MLIFLFFYKAKINFNYFLIFSLYYLLFIIINLPFIFEFFFSNEHITLQTNTKLFFKPFYFDIFRIKIGFLEFYFIYIVCLISFFANVLSFFYLNDDKKKKKFFLFLNFFTFSMLLFIIQDCFFLLLLS